MPAGRKRPRGAADEPAPVVGALRLGVVPGATPGRWVDAWRERHPRAELSLVDLAADGARAALDAGEVDAALVRLPLDRTDLHVIPLYDETVVVVFPADSHLAAADELTIGDLAGETVIVPIDDVLHLEVPGTVAPTFSDPLDTAGAVATVASGIGILIVPQSLARLHRRRDVDTRPLAGAAPAPVALAWQAAATTPAVEAFVGIVRGRTAASSRG